MKTKLIDYLVSFVFIFCFLVCFTNLANSQNFKKKHFPISHNSNNNVEKSSSINELNRNNDSNALIEQNAEVNHDQSIQSAKPLNFQIIFDVD